MEWYVYLSTGTRVVTAILKCGLQTQPQRFTVRPQSHAGGPSDPHLGRAAKNNSISCYLGIL